MENGRCLTMLQKWLPPPPVNCSMRMQQGIQEQRDSHCSTHGDFARSEVMLPPPPPVDCSMRMRQRVQQQRDSHSPPIVGTAGSGMMLPPPPLMSSYDPMMLVGRVCSELILPPPPPPMNCSMRLQQRNSNDLMLGAACPVMMPPPPPMSYSMQLRQWMEQRNSHDPMFVGTVCYVRMLRPRP